jgi:hypothetical protein
VEYDRVIWSGLSWAVGEVRQSDLRPGSPVTLSFKTTEKSAVTLQAKLYRVRY